MTMNWATQARTSARLARRRRADCRSCCGGAELSLYMVSPGCEKTCTMTVVQASKVRRSSYNGRVGTMTTQAEAASAITHPARDDIELAAVLHALSDPMRLRIVVALAGGERPLTCGSIDLPITKSTCTHHFKVLRE